MKKALMIVTVLFIAVISTGCINNIAVQELNNKAAEYMQKGDYDAAVSRLQASIDLDSSMYETYYNLGVAAINAKKYKIAIEALQAGIKLKPEYSDFYYSLGLAQYNLADEYAEIEDNQETVNKANSDEQTPEEYMQKAVKLKKLSILTFSKYIKESQNAEDKDLAVDMMTSAKKFIKQHEGITKEEPAE